MRKRTQLSHWPESVHSNTLQTRSSPTPPKQLWLLWNIGKRQSFHHCLTIQRYQNWQVKKNSNKHAVNHPPKNISHTHTPTRTRTHAQCPHISRMFLLKKGLIFGVRTIPTFHLREFLLSTFWAQKSSASWFFSGTWSHFHYSNSMFSRPWAKCVPTIKLQSNHNSSRISCTFTSFTKRPQWNPWEYHMQHEGINPCAFRSSSSDAAFNTWRGYSLLGWKKCSSYRL